MLSKTNGATPGRAVPDVTGRGASELGELACAPRKAPNAPVSLADVRQAHARIGEHLAPTPLVSHPLLNQRVGAEVFVKLENTQSIGSFKIRGGINLLAQLSSDERRRGIVTATRGNHGQSLARAAGLYGARCTIYVPRGNNPHKNAAMEALGATVVVEGHDFDAAMAAAEAYADETGARLVHPAREPALIAGVGTVALEMLAQAGGGLDVLYVPVGGGSLASGMAITMKALSPATRLVGVSAENAPAMHHAWHTGEDRAFVTTETIADGLAVRLPVDMTLGVLRPLLDDWVLVSEAEIQQAVRCYAETIHQLAEGAAAAGLAAALRHEGGTHRNVGLVMTGGNIDTETLKRALAGEAPHHHPQAVPYYPIGELSYGY